MGKCLYIRIAAMLAIVALLGAGVTALTAPREPSTDCLRVVTSFYPVYIAAQNIAGDVEGVEVLNMVDGQFGCLHDYQMSPQDRVILDSADVFVMNGAGAEPFLSAVLEHNPPQSVIDLSAGVALLESGHVHHGEEHDHDVAEEASVNDHVWMSPSRYRQQIETLRDGLIAADPAHAAHYRDNAATYLASITAAQTRLADAAAPFDGIKLVLMHDSLAYLAAELDWHVAAALNIGEESGVSAATLLAAEDALVGEQAALFLYDSQYDADDYAYLRQIPQDCRVIAVDTCVSGDGNADHWLSAMTALCEALEAGV